MSSPKVGSLQDELVRKADQLIPSSSIGHLPRTAIVETAGGSRYKLRRYPSAFRAKAIESSLESASAHVPMLLPLFRQDDLLGFEIVVLDAPPVDASPAQELGRFLGKLSGVFSGHREANTVIDAFKDDLETLVTAGFLSRQAASACRSLFDRLLPDEPAIELAYWDAMPRNFGWVDGAFTLLDEKHLRPGFAGVSLIKPQLSFDELDWAAFQNGYREYADPGHDETDQDFLTLNYLVGALNFYALQMIDGRSDVPKNHRMRRYRQALNRRIYDCQGQQMRETIGFLLRFPAATAAEFGRRARKRWQHRFRQAEEASGTQESEKLSEYRHA